MTDDRPIGREPRTVEELAEQQGATPKTVEDWYASAPEGIFESDDEVDEFIRFVREQRDSNGMA